MRLKRLFSKKKIERKKLIKLFCYFDFSDKFYLRNSDLFDAENFPFIPKWQGVNLDQPFENSLLEEIMNGHIPLREMSISDQSKDEYFMLSFRKKEHVLVRFVCSLENFNGWRHRQTLLESNYLKIAYLTDLGFDRANNTIHRESIKKLGYSEKHFTLVYNDLMQKKVVDIEKNVGKRYLLDAQTYFIGSAYAFIVNPKRYYKNVAQDLIKFDKYSKVENYNDNIAMYLFENPFNGIDKKNLELRKELIDSLIANNKFYEN